MPNMGEINTETLARILRDRMPAADFRLTPISTGRHNASFWVDGAGGPYVLRIAPPSDAGLLFYERDMMRQEPQIHALVRARTTIPAPEIVFHDFTRQRLDRDYLLMRAVPGRPFSHEKGLDGRQLAGVLRQTGAYLRQLHSLIATDCLGTRAYGYLGNHRPMQPQPAWPDAFRVMWDKLVDDVQACGCYSETEAGSVRNLLDRFLPLFDRPVEPCLLHMDVWSENILINAEGKVTGLVDFDRALWGDVEIEFAVLDYCGISEPAFWKGYGAARDTSQAARIRRLFYLLYELQKYMPIYVWRRPNSETRVHRFKQQAAGLLAQLGCKL